MTGNFFERIPRSVLVVTSVVVFGTVAIALAIFLLPGSAGSGMGIGNPEKGGTERAAEASPSRCGLPGFEKSATQTQAPTAAWLLVGESKAPQVKDVGPGVIAADGMRYCYSHTSMGAVLASANLVAIARIPELRDQISAELLLLQSGSSPSATRETSPASPTATTASASSSPTQSEDSAPTLDIRGFSLVDYSETKATVQLAYEFQGTFVEPSRRYFTASISMQWQAGDWRLNTQDLEAIPTGTRADLAGFTPWSRPSLP